MESYKTPTPESSKHLGNKRRCTRSVHSPRLSRMVGSETLLVRCINKSPQPYRSECQKPKIRPRPHLLAASSSCCHQNVALHCIFRSALKPHLSCMTCSSSRSTGVIPRQSIDIPVSVPLSHFC